MGPSFSDGTEIREDRLLGNARQSPVEFFARGLVIEEKEIRRGKGGEQNVPGAESRGLHSRVQSLRLRRFEEGKGEIRLEERFSAGEGHAPAARLVKDPVGEDFSDHLRDFVFLPHGAETSGEAGFGAGPAPDAPLPVVDVASVPPEDMAAPRADGGAGTASDALFRVEFDLPFSFQSFGIVAPETAERTALQKDRRADPRAVVDGKLLNIENAAFHAPASFPGLLPL